MSVCTVNPCQPGPYVEERRGLQPKIDGTKYGASAGDVLIAFVSGHEPIFAFIKKNHPRSRQEAGDRLSQLRAESLKSQSQINKGISKSQNYKGVLPGLTMTEDTEQGMKDRPVILITGYPDVRKICIMATFEGKDITTLPSLLQRFLVPVYTTAFPGAMNHIHTAPTWRGSGKPQWVIAYPWDAQSELHLNIRWSDDNGTGPTNYTVDDQVLLYLNTFAVNATNSFKRESAGKQAEEIEKYEVALHCHLTQKNSRSCPF